MSIRKWLPNARGMDINGLGILVAIAAPTITCGVSNTVPYDILGLKSMSNILPVILFSLVSFFTYLFFLWKNLREDYDVGRVFTFGIATFFAFIIGSLLGRILGNFWYWIGLVCFVAVSVLLIRRFEFRIIEVIEASTPGILIVHLLLFLLGLLRNQSINHILMVLLGLLLIILFVVLKKNYKRFTFYKSGRLGFASLVTLGLLYLIRAITALVAPHTISHIGVFEFIPAAIISFFSFLTVYNLGNE